MNKKLDVKAFGFAIGILWAATVLIMSVLAASQIGEWTMPVIEFLSTFYLGLKATLTGALIGGVWAFVDGFIGGIIFAWLYNKISK